MKLKIGQILYLVPQGNFARGKRDIIYTVKVSHIGRKYGTVTSDEIVFTRDISDKFKLDSLENENGDYSPQYQLFTDFDDIRNKPELRTKVNSMLYGLSYKELKIVEKTLENIKSNRL